MKIRLGVRNVILQYSIPSPQLSPACHVKHPGTEMLSKALLLVWCSPHGIQREATKNQLHEQQNQFPMDSWFDKS